MNKIFIIILLILGLVIVLAFGFLQEKKNNTEKTLECPGCNLMIISLTNVRKDHVGLYGYSRETTPNIDSFFKNSLIFNNAFAPASWTLPNAASFFTSLFPYSHGVMMRDREKIQSLNTDILTFPEILKDNGYATAAFTGDGDYNRRYGLSQGFDFYLDADNYKDFGNQIMRQLGRGLLTYSPLRATLPISLGWLKNNANKKFFFFLQGYDAHCPFMPQAPFNRKFTDGLQSQIDFSSCLWTFDKVDPIYRDGKKYWPVKTSLGLRINGVDVDDNALLSEEDVKFMIALYDGAIAESDFYLKALFEEIKALNLEKNTIFVFMAEHGDLFGEHGRFMRGGPLRGTFYDPVLNFPIVIKHPNIKEPIIINDLIQTVDLMPTLLNMLGLGDPQSKIRQGKQLSFSAFGDEEVNRYVYSASRFTARRNDQFFNGTSIVESIRNKEWKLIQESISDSKTFEIKTGKRNVEFHELYNIREDPYELNNLYESQTNVVSDLENKLSQWIKNLRQP